MGIIILNIRNGPGHIEMTRMIAMIVGLRFEWFLVSQSKGLHPILVDC